MGPDELQQLHESFGGTVLRTFPAFGNVQVVRIPEGSSVDEALALYQSSGRLDYAERDYLVKLDAEPNDPKFTEGSLWGLHNTGQNGGTNDADIDAPEGWDILNAADNIVVAVIDTGIRYTHQDLATNLWTNPGEIAGNGVDDDGNGYVDDVHGINTITGSGDPNDDHGHGTHVSGTIGAAGNDGVGVAGVAWRVQLMGCKFLGSGGSGFTSDAVECVDYARSMGAKVMSNSWGGGGYSQALYDSIAAARDAGIVFVAAAGNSAKNTDTLINFPSGYDLDNIVSVAATDRNDQLASFSNWGPSSVDLGAPGVSTLSTWNCSDDCYNTISGTSMATPHVSGVFALMAASFPFDGYAQLIERVVDSTDSIPALAGKTRSGGRLNLHNALLSYPPPGPTVSIDDVTVNEGHAGVTSAVFTVTLQSPPDGQTVTVNYATADGTASAGADYVATSGSLSFAPGQTTNTIAVAVNGDGAAEASETFLVNLSGATNANIGDGHGQGTITNDDVSALSIDDVSVVEGNSGATNAVFTVSISPPNEQTVTIHYETSDGTASAGRSKQTNATTITIRGSYGPTSPATATPYPSTIVVPPQPGAVTKVNLTLNGFSHSFTRDVDVLLVGPTGRAVVLMSDVGSWNSVQGATLTFDDSGLLLGSGKVASGTYRPTNLADYEGPDSYPAPAPAPPYGALLSAFVGLPAAGTWSLYVVDDYPWVDGGSINGWTLELETSGGEDYVATSGTLTFPPGVTAQTLSVSVNGDAIGELDETFFVTLSQPTAAVLADAQGMATVVNDDSTSLSVADVKLAEGDNGATHAVFTVLLAPALGGPVTVDYATADGTATSGSDYVAQSSSLTFLPGQTTQTVSVVVNGDLAIEDDESFFLNLSNAAGAPIHDAQALATILDDDGGDGLIGAYYDDPFDFLSNPFARRVDPTIDFDWGTGAPFLGMGPDTFVVRWSGQVLPAFSQTYQFCSRTDDAVQLYVNYELVVNKPFDQTAIEWCGQIALVGGKRYEIRMDYHHTTGSALAQLYWSSPSTPKAVIPRNRLFSSPVTIWVDDIAVLEGTGGMTNAVFSVTLSRSSNEPVSVEYYTYSYDATPGADYTPASGTLVFAPGELIKTVTVPVVADTLAESDEFFQLYLSVPTSALLGKYWAYARIVNDDVAKLSIGDVSTVEGNSGTSNAVFTVSMSNPSAQNVTVDYATADGTAKSAGTSVSHSNSSAITIPGSGPSAVPASPYPSAIVVPSLPAPVTRVNVTLKGFSHTFPQDVDVLLVGPGGQAVVLMSDAGYAYSVSNLNLTFDDGGIPLPRALLTSGTYQPTNIQDFDGGDGYPAPAPAGPFGGALSVFSGLNPAGTWRLYVVDDFGGVDGGSFAGGWSLSFQTSRGDYEVTGGKLTFASGETSKTVSVPVNGDSSGEPDETLFVNLSSPTGGATLADAQAKGTIVNDDPPGLAVEDAVVTEGDGGTVNATFTVTLFPAVSQTVTVNYATGDGTATGLVDYVPTSGGLTFAPGETEKTVNVAIHGDVVPEPDETVLLNLSGAVGVPINDAQAQATIKNDDVGVYVAPGCVLQSGSRAVSVNVAGGPGNASDWIALYPPGSSSYSDWWYLDGTKTAPQFGATSASFDVTLPAGLGHYTFKLIRYTTGLPVFTSNAVQVASFCGPALSIDDVTIGESITGSVNASLTVTLSQSVAASVSVNYATANGTATAGSDYTSASGTLSFAAGETSKTISVALIDDTIMEGNETFDVVLSDATGGPPILDAVGKVTIADNEVGIAASPSCVLASSSRVVSVATAGGPGNAADWAALFPGGSGNYLDWWFLNGTKQPPGSGFSNAAFNVTLPPGTGSYFFKLLNYSNGQPVFTSNTVQVASTCGPAFSIGDASVTEGDAGSVNADFTVTLSQTVAGTVTVDYATSIGTASPGSDYTTTNGTLSFNSGETSKTISVPVLGDTAVEGNESFFVNLSNATGGPAITDNQGLGTIVDNEVTPSGVSVSPSCALASGNRQVTVTVAGGPANAADWAAVYPASGGGYLDWWYLNGLKTAPASGSANTSFTAVLPPAAGSYVVKLINYTTGQPVFTSNTVQVAASCGPTLGIDDVSVIEGDTGSLSAVFTVTLSQSVAGAVTVDYATANGTAGADSDYTATNGTLTFDSGETSKTISVPVLGDTAVEGNETLFVNLSNPAGGPTIADNQGLGTIVDNEIPPSGVTVSPSCVVSSGNRLVSVTTAGGPGHASDWAALYASAGGSYIDWWYLNGLKTPPASGSPNTSFSVVLAAGVNSYIVKLINYTTGQPVFTSNTVQVAASCGPTLAIGDASVTEGDSGSLNAIFTVTLSQAVAGDVSVDYTTANGTAGAGSDYTTTNGTLTFTSGHTSKTISVPVLGDGAVEGNETFFLNLTNATGGPTIADTQGLGTIVDNDAPSSGISATPSCVLAGGAVTVSVAGGPGNTSDWVELYASGGSPYVDWWYLNGTKTAPSAGSPNTTFSVPMPSSPGGYVLKLINYTTGQPVFTSNVVLASTSCGP